MSDDGPSKSTRLIKAGSPRFTKIENQLKSVENYKVTQLQLIKILREKNILTKQDAATLGVT
jgi:hypothetical protein